ncbi:uncharacterized protein LOC114446469 [Parambassis ranga]|uniref:Uncharacterized protein LOC114446469 n=1 Tax=Parambassis ranga TaxID=210632 RepID=A0A6P7JLT1_9TELE|nr:uncharacterized protein LOC114446469 [Parambassis ranga]
MGRYKRDGGLPNKRDTPVKPALRRQDKNRRPLPSSHYDALPEELEVKVYKPTTHQTAPALYKTVLHLRSSDNPSCKSSSPATAANDKSGYQISHPGQVTPTLKAFSGDQTPGKEPLAVTPSSSTDPDTTSSSDDNDEDCYSSDFTTSSSLPSPEIFRREIDGERLSLPFEEDSLDLHLHIKNSTLLDVSHAESIRMYHAPNLSAIIDVSKNLPENNFDISNPSEPEPETKTKTGLLKSDKAFETQSKLTKRKPILYRKKVWFKSPVVSETFRTNLTPATKLCTTEVKPDVDTPGVGVISFKEESLPLKVEIKRPVTTSPEKVSFFDFVDDKERDAFFQKMRERCAKLKNAALFPLTAAVHTKPSVTLDLSLEY